MKTRPIGSWIAIVATSAAVVACGDGGPSRADVAGAIIDAVPPRFADLADSASALPDAVDRWCTTGDPSPLVEQVAVIRTAWLELAPFFSGPVMERRSRFVVDPRTVADSIDEFAATDRPVDAIALRELAAANQRGLAAIEHLTTQPADDCRCDYAAGVSDLVVEETAAVAADWVVYAPTVVADDASANLALRDMVSESLSSIRMVGVEPGASGATALLDGVRALLLGDESGEGLSPLLTDATLDQLSDELDAAAALDLERTITTSVAAELGVTVSFSDADGDA